MNGTWPFPRRVGMVRGWVRPDADGGYRHPVPKHPPGTLGGYDFPAGAPISDGAHQKMKSLLSRSETLTPLMTRMSVPCSMTVSWATCMTRRSDMLSTPERWL